MWSALWKIRSELQRLIRQQEGQSLVEYALLLLMIAAAAVATIGHFANTLVTYMQYSNSKLP
jgi:Flp pilus assembly pilin Flp